MGSLLSHTLVWHSPKKTLKPSKIQYLALVDILHFTLMICNFNISMVKMPSHTVRFSPIFRSFKNTIRRSGWVIRDHERCFTQVLKIGALWASKSLVLKKKWTAATLTATQAVSVPVAAMPVPRAIMPVDALPATAGPVLTLAAAGPELDALLDAVGRGGGCVGCPFAVEPAMGRPAALGATAAGLEESVSASF